MRAILKQRVGYPRSNLSPPAARLQKNFESWQATNGHDAKSVAGRLRPTWPYASCCSKLAKKYRRAHFAIKIPNSNHSERERILRAAEPELANVVPCNRKVPPCLSISRVPRLFEAQMHTSLIPIFEFLKGSSHLARRWVDGGSNAICMR